MNKDLFSEHGRSLTGPATSLFKAILHDSEELKYYCRAFMVKNDGDVSLVTLNDDEIVLPNCREGVIYPIRCKQIKLTGTTVNEVICLV